MSNGAADFEGMVRKYLNIGDRRVSFRHEHRLGGPAHYYDMVIVNFINHPTAVGAEAENNRMSFTVKGFHGSDPHGEPPTGKVKIETLTSVLPREWNLRAKTGKPEVIAKYLADRLNLVAYTFSPNVLAKL